MERNLPNQDIYMVLPDLETAPRFEFPAGYRMRFFREEDVPLWVSIQQAADTLFTATEETFEKSMPGTTAYRAERIMFLLDPQDQTIGTITAWNSSKFTEDASETGHVHWVAISPEGQGKGLAKPMLSAALAEMQKRGYTTAWLETNTQRLPALNLYLKFGFQPILADPAIQTAWQQIKPALKYG